MWNLKEEVFREILEIFIGRFGVFVWGRIFYSYYFYEGIEWLYLLDLFGNFFFEYFFIFGFGGIILGGFERFYCINKKERFIDFLGWGWSGILFVRVFGILRCL